MRFGLAAVILFSFVGSAYAQTVAPLDIAAKQAYIVDAATGTVLFAKDADTKMPTSSMSKMLTMYLVFDALKTGKLKLDDTLPVSERAWKQEGSRMFCNVRDSVKIEDLIRGVAVQSGNDAAVVLAEGLGSGSEATFADMMNAKAKDLGLTNSHFMNATGLPDPQHYSTARDLGTLALALQRDFPDYYHYFSETTFTYNKISQGNRNPLLYRNMNVDGIKTGHTVEGGFGLAASAVRDGRRLVLVLNGMKNMQSRADESAKALDYGYREFGLYTVAKEGDVLANPAVWLGKEKSVQIVAARNIAITLPRTARSGLKATVSFNQPIPAPIVKGDAIGTLTVTAPGMEAKTISLVAAADVERLGFFQQIAEKLKVLLKRK
ncbi:MAG: D-alanyl-D-alanine carboxypeptidase family protein [Bdellovibrionales bacterium]